MHSRERNRTREARHLDEIQAGVSNKLKLFRHGFVDFIHWLDAALRLRTRRRRPLTTWGRGNYWRRGVTLPGNVSLQFICDSLFDHILNGIAKRR